jgi:hypothetical protein
MQSSVILKHFLDDNQELQDIFLIGLEVECGGDEWTKKEADFIFGAILLDLQIVNKRAIIRWGIEVRREKGVN